MVDLVSVYVFHWGWDVFHVLGFSIEVSKPEILMLGLLCLATLPLFPDHLRNSCQWTTCRSFVLFDAVRESDPGMFLGLRLYPTFRLAESLVIPPTEFYIVSFSRFV